MWKLLLLIACLQFRNGCCELSKDDLKLEVQAAVEKYLGEYKHTIEALQSEVMDLKAVVTHQESRIDELESRLTDNSKHDEKQVLQSGSSKSSVSKDKSSVNSDRSSIGSDRSSINNDKSSVSSDRSSVNSAPTVGNIESVIQNGTNGNSKTPAHRMDKQGDLDNAPASFSRRVPSLINKRQVTHTSTNVAFCAYLDHNVLHMGIGHTIKYNQLILNDGHAYNSHTGVFTAPVTGVYLFMFHYDSVTGKAEIHLVVDDVNIVGSVASHGTTRFDIMGGNSAIVRVNAGQGVWIEPYNLNDQEILSGSGYHKSTFSGVLLYNTE